MDYDAPYLAHQALITRAGAAFDAELADVIAERDLRLTANRKVYDGTVPVEELASPTIPCIEVRLPEGDVTVAADSAESTAEVWVLATVPRKESGAVMAYLSALCRTYFYFEGRAETATYTGELAGYSCSPPFTVNGNAVQSVGVRVLLTISE